MSILNDDIDYEPLYEGFIANLKEKYSIDIEQEDIQWRGFGSQGDGLSFDFKLESSDVTSFLEAIDAPHYEKILEFYNTDYIFQITIETIKNNFATNYCHSNTRDISFWFATYEPKITSMQMDLDKIKKDIPKIEQYIKEWYRITCDEFYDLISSYYEEQCSDMPDFPEDDFGDLTISDVIDSRIDPEMNIEKVVEMINDAKDLSYTKGEGIAMIEIFIENFNKEYLIIKKIN